MKRQHEDTNKSQENEACPTQREKNNASVKRSREKRKKKIEETQENLKKLNTENTELQNEISVLTKELSFLKALLLSFSEHDCSKHDPLELKASELKASYFNQNNPGNHSEATTKYCNTEDERESSLSP